MHTRRRDTSEAILDHWWSMQSLRRSWKDLSSVSRTHIQDSATSHDRGCSEGDWRRNHDHGMKARLFSSVNASQHNSSCRQAFSESAPCTLYRTDEQGFQILIFIFLSFILWNAKLDHSITTSSQTTQAFSLKKHTFIFRTPDRSSFWLDSETLHTISDQCDQTWSDSFCDSTNTTSLERWNHRMQRHTKSVCRRGLSRECKIFSKHSKLIFLFHNFFLCLKLSTQAASAWRLKLRCLRNLKTYCLKKMHAVQGFLSKTWTTDFSKRSDADCSTVKRWLLNLRIEQSVWSRTPAIIRYEKTILNSSSMTKVVSDVWTAEDLSQSEKFFSIRRWLRVQSRCSNMPSKTMCNSFIFAMWSWRMSNIRRWTILWSSVLPIATKRFRFTDRISAFIEYRENELAISFVVNGRSLLAFLLIRRFPKVRNESVKCLQKESRSIRFRLSTNSVQSLGILWLLMNGMNKIPSKVKSHNAEKCCKVWQSEYIHRRRDSYFFIFFFYGNVFTICHDIREHGNHRGSDFDRYSLQPATQANHEESSWIIERRSRQKDRSNIQGIQKGNIRLKNWIL